MNLEMAKQLVWYGGMIAAIMGLIWVIWQMSQKGEHPPEDSNEHVYQRKFLGISWSMFLLPAVLILVVMGLTPGRTGARGALASLLLGILTTLFLASLESQVLRKKQEDLLMTCLFIQ